MNSKKEKIILTQIKQDFTTPVDAISDYINLIIDGSDIYDDEISEEFENIKKSAKTLRVNFNEAFLEFAETKRKKITSPPFYCVVVLKRGSMAQILFS